jgi:threonine dehydrogenase-like Zn-dependent dehydrogenase
MQTGDVLGHEFCGVIESVGPGVKNLKPGQRVVASFQIACGECRNCKNLLTAHCERANASKTMNNLMGGHVGGIFGYSHLLGGFAGGQAEFVRVPWGDNNLLPLPDDVPDEKALYLSDVICTAWHCVTDSGVKKGDVVAVWGGGPIGQNVCEMSFIKGASRVILIDGGAGSWRLDFVKSKVPQLETLNYSDIPRGESVSSKLKEMTGGTGPDVCLECAGGEYAKGWLHAIETAVGMEMDTSELINEMVTAVKVFGTCGIIADYVGYVCDFPVLFGIHLPFR